MAKDCLGFTHRRSPEPNVSWAGVKDGPHAPGRHSRPTRPPKSNFAKRRIQGHKRPRQTPDERAPHHPRSSETCPSSNDVEQVAHSWSRSLGFIWFRSGWLALMGQAAVLDGLRLDASPVGQNGSTATEIDVAGGEVTEAFMVSASVAMIGEGGDGAFYFALHAVVLQQDAVLDGDWPIVCWTPCGFSFCCCTQGSVAGRSPRECGR